MVDHVIRPGNSGIQSSPHYVAVAPNDTTNLAYITRGLYVGVAGDISVICPNTNAAITFVGIPAGAVLPIQTARVRATGTTATNIVALF